MSYFESKRLKEERAGLVNQIHEITKTINAEKRVMTPEEKERFDKLDADQEEMRLKLATAERLEKAETLNVAQAERAINNTTYSQRTTPEDHKNALRAWGLRSKPELIRPEWRESAAKVGIDPSGDWLTVRLNPITHQFWELRAQTVGTGSQGGFSAEESTLQREISENQKAFGGIRKYARVIQRQSGETLKWLTLDDSANAAETHSENADVNNTSVAFGQKEIPTTMYDTGVFPVSYELLRDSVFNLNELIARTCGKRIARKQNIDFTASLIADATAGTATASATVVTYPELVKHYHKLDPDYRDDPSCAWMMNDATIGGQVKAMADSTGRPIWNTNLQAIGSVDFLLSKPIIANDQVPVVAGSSKSILFGAGYYSVITDVNEVQIQRLNEVYASKLAVGFICWHASGFKLLQPTSCYYLPMHS